MSTRKLHFRDIPGPWQSEPDRYQWQFAGLDCLIVRHLVLGHWCGYVRLPDEVVAYVCKLKLDGIDVHGGITFERTMPHGGYWVGFDCGHAGDFSPGLAALLGTHGPAGSVSRLCVKERYRDMPYAIEQTDSLAKQIKEQLK